MIRSTSGLLFETKLETISLGPIERPLRVWVESLADLELTIDRLFQLYLSQGQQQLLEDMCPYFGTVWPAGRVLAEIVASWDVGALGLPEKRVLEVGCGLALPSLVLAHRGVRTTCIDLHPDVPLFLEANCRHNQVADLPVIISDWSKWESDQTWDIVLASDVLYDRAQPDALLAFLERAVSSSGMALVTDPGRGYWSGFTETAKQAQWRVSSSGLYGVNTCELRRV